MEHELDAEAESLLAQFRAHYEPKGQVEERIWTGVLESLPAEVLAPEPTRHKSPRPRARTRWLAAIGACVCALVVLAWAPWRSVGDGETEPESSNRPPLVLPPLPAETRAARPDPAPTEALRGDVEGIQSIRRLRDSGNHEAALTELAAHAERFPRSLYAEERAFLAVASECDLGRLAAARARARGYLERWPDSPRLYTIPSACRPPGTKDRRSSTSE